MFYFLSQMSDVPLFILLNLISIIISIIAIYVVKLYVPLGIRYKDNAVIGYSTALISVIYGVLAGLSALYLFNNNSYTSTAVQQEANAIANIYRESKWLDEPSRSKIQIEVKAYLTNVIENEWPVMQASKKIDEVGDSIINNISNQLNSYRQSAGVQALVFADVIRQVNALYDARHIRIQMSHSGLSPELWVVILIGTILTLVINYIFGMNFYLHVITVVAASLMTSSMIFLLITLDKPFQGEFIIPPDAFISVLNYVSTK